MPKIVLECCGGKEQHKGQCLKGRCRHYTKAREKVHQSWRYMATGFGNGYGNPDHGDFLAQVRKDLEKKS